MTLETLNIAHITKEISQLPFQRDRDRLNLVKSALENNEPLELEDRFYFDTIANDITRVADKKGETTTAAFLMMQLPFLHADMVSHYIECVFRDENPIGAYFAVQLNGAIKSIEHNDRLISIIIDNGDVPLWIESVRNIPNIPIEVIIKKVSQANSEYMQLWDKEVGAQAKLMHKEFCESLKNPIERSDYNTPEKDREEEDRKLSRIAKIKSGFGSPIKAIRSRKKP